MDYNVETYVEFFELEYSYYQLAPAKVPSRDIGSLKIPEGTYGFEFTTVISATINYNGQQVELKSQPIDRQRYFLRGKIYSREEIEKIFEIEDRFGGILMGIKAAGTNRGIEVAPGKQYPLMEGDIVLDPL